MLKLGGEVATGKGSGRLHYIRQAAEADGGNRSGRGMAGIFRGAIFVLGLSSRIFGLGTMLRTGFRFLVSFVWLSKI